jgi:GNAT superfamily N-acetyltransferase
MTLEEAIKLDSVPVIACAGTEPVGIGALPPLGPGVAEIKRMYVVPGHRGSGVASRILPERMYMEAGYREISDHNGNPRANRWFERSLRELT